MRIARPKRPAAEFKRKRSPPPQATKLLRFALISGIVFMVLLGIVFIPQGLRDQSPREVVNPEEGGKFRLDTSNGMRLYVDTTTASLALSEFNASFKVNKAEIGYLEPGLAMGNATLSFTWKRERTPGCWRLLHNPAASERLLPIRCLPSERRDAGRLAGVGRLSVTFN